MVHKRTAITFLLTLSFVDSNDIYCVLIKVKGKSFFSMMKKLIFLLCAIFAHLICLTNAAKGKFFKLINEAVLSQY